MWEKESFVHNMPRRGTEVIQNSKFQELSGELRLYWKCSGNLAIKLGVAWETNMHTLLNSIIKLDKVNWFILYYFPLVLGIIFPTKLQDRYKRIVIGEYGHSTFFMNILGSQVGMNKAALLAYLLVNELLCIEATWEWIWTLVQTTLGNILRQRLTLSWWNLSLLSLTFSLPLKWLWGYIRKEGNVTSTFTRDTLKNFKGKLFMPDQEHEICLLSGW